MVEEGGAKQKIDNGLSSTTGFSKPEIKQFQYHWLIK